MFRSEYGDGAFRSWAAVPITYRSMTQGRSTSTSTTPSRARCSRDPDQPALYLHRHLYGVAGDGGGVLQGPHPAYRPAPAGIHTVREGEYSHRVSVRGGDELSRLADEFNELTGRLQTTEEVRASSPTPPMSSKPRWPPSACSPTPCYRPTTWTARRHGVPQRHRGRG
ncbi:cell wall metabolism sensor histidine kinase WalK [Flavonifractor plautii]|nr:cell wall metabolism sensor histidine kinase WalK [Flavonifractor plautii]